jgi:glycosyltransferase involved in cell wall biosynthesis
MTQKPTVTVWMNSYNHEKFVAQAIESVLAQKNVDFEFLIADDGSSDNTQNVIASFTDKRIKFFPHKINRGACVVTNELIQMASGEYLAKINSDDIWIGDDKLEYQLQIMRDNPLLGACLGRPRFIDEQGIQIVPPSPLDKVFMQKNRSQAQWVRHFFIHPNCLCQPTLMVKKECYEKVGLYDNRLRQLPDFDFWVRLVKHYPIHIADRDLIYIRILPGKNASAGTDDNLARLCNEHYMISKSYLNGVSPSLLVEAFSDFLRFKNFPTPQHLDIEKALLHFVPLSSSSFTKLNQFIGLSKIFKLLNSDQYREILENDYQINDLWFQQKMSTVSIVEPGLVSEAEVLAKLYASRSWRLTAPIRKMAEILRKIRDGL